MGGLKVEVEPAEVGLDPGRLERIGRHFARYVDDGRLAGWLVTVNRRGRLAYVASYGSRDAEADRPVHRDQPAGQPPVVHVAGEMAADPLQPFRVQPHLGRVHLNLEFAHAASPAHDVRLTSTD